ncbi:hypothetical protein JOC85_003628 [Bacillus mesophilus]|uniref:Uncharacterized protein n=1 Tax=Bacillus mesophilus TaxID=1808955 RepID=A0A6M0QAX9_9BACI|nr:MULTISPECIES: hypothetical protein [Bacillus]MBM7662817.1 hypothetical protein [Bacillus mesophilus]NEY73407.1 hypothetical protein [Bacillus mesophilus]
MSISERIIKDLEMLDEIEREKVLHKIIEKYISKDKAILLGKTFDWWNNEEDDIYNE